MYQHLWLKIHHFTKRKVIFSQTLWNNNNDQWSWFWCSALISRELRDYASICHPLVGPGHLGPKSAFRTSRRGVFAPVFLRWCVVFGILKMCVSENSGTTKSSILIGFSIKNHPFWGTPIFGNTQMLPLYFHEFLSWSFWCVKRGHFLKVKNCRMSESSEWSNLTPQTPNRWGFNGSWLMWQIFSYSLREKTPPVIQGGLVPVICGVIKDNGYDPIYQSKRSYLGVITLLAHLPVAGVGSVRLFARPSIAVTLWGGGSTSLLGEQWSVNLWVGWII